MLNGKLLGLALDDIVAGVMSWRIWQMLGTNDVRSRYRRSTLGPFWNSLSMAVQALVTAFVFGFLFNLPNERYLPFLCLSLVLWFFIVSTVNEGASAFISAGELILQVRRPFTVYIMQVMWRNLIIFGHTIVIFFVVAFLYGQFPGPVYLLAIPGFVLLVLNVAWASFLSAILSTRFRDVPMIVQNAFTVLFWLTPIVYMPNQLGGYVEQMVRLNPLTHVVQVVRDPLLLSQPTLENWVVATSTALVGWAVTLLTFARFRSRIAYWL